MSGYWYADPKYTVVDLTACSAPYPDIVQEQAALVAVVPPKATALVGWCADPKCNFVDLTARSSSYLGVQIPQCWISPGRGTEAGCLGWLQWFLQKLTALSGCTLVGRLTEQCLANLAMVDWVDTGLRGPRVDCMVKFCEPSIWPPYKTKLR